MLQLPFLVDSKSATVSISKLFKLKHIHQGAGPEIL